MFKSLEEFEDRRLASNRTLNAIGSLDINASLPNDEFDQFNRNFQHAIHLLNIYVLPVIILIGILGNTISFIVYCGTPRLHRQSSSVYLAFLAAVDNISLITILFVWFGWVGVHIFHKNGWCQTITYCTYFCSFLSAWTVVSFTVERWIVVFHPLKRQVFCTRKRAILVMTSLTVTAMLFYSFTLFTTKVRYHNGMPLCTEDQKYHGAMQVIRSIDTIMIVVAPLIAIIIMNAAIGIKICHYTGKIMAGSIPARIPEHSVDEMYSSCNNSTLQKIPMEVRRPTRLKSSILKEESRLRINLFTGNCNAVQTGNVDGNSAKKSRAKKTLIITANQVGDVIKAEVGKMSHMDEEELERELEHGQVEGDCLTPGKQVPAVLTASPNGTTASVILSTGGGARSWRVLTRRQQTQVRITRALLIVSTVFLVLNLPSYAFRIHAFVISIRNETYNFYESWVQHAIWQEFIQILYYSNFSSRFFLYSACSRNFRYALKRWVCSCRQRR